MGYSLFFAVMHQTAQVVVLNKTGRALRYVNILHKYSDNYRNTREWGVGADSPAPRPSEASSAMSVDYNTGFLTTGRDWWLVTWQFEGERKFYYTNPDNFRSIIDFLEAPVKALVDKALDAIGEEYPGLSDAGKIIVNLAFNTESTAGLKQHILRDEDAGRVTQILINADNTVEWHSPSGTSSTVSGVYGDLGVVGFTGTCGEGRTPGQPMHISSDTGLRSNDQVSVNGSTDLSRCLVGNDNACVYGINMQTEGGTRVYNYVINVDARGPEGFGSGSLYLAFTDESGDTYTLSIYSSTRSVHTVRYNSDKPAIKRIYWSDYSFNV